MKYETNLEEILEPLYIDETKRLQMLKYLLGEYFGPRVEAGIKVLDENFGREKWLKMINVKTLDLSDPTTCVCGQLFLEYANGIFTNTNKGIVKVEDDEEWSTNHGFYVDADSSEGDFCDVDWAAYGLDGHVGNSTLYDALGEVWIARIKDLSAKVNVRKPRKRKPGRPRKQA